MRIKKSLRTAAAISAVAGQPPSKVIRRNDPEPEKPEQLSDEDTARIEAATLRQYGKRMRKLADRERTRKNRLSFKQISA